MGTEAQKKKKKKKKKNTKKIKKKKRSNIDCTYVNRLMAGGCCSSHALKIFRVLLVLEIMTAVGLVPDDVVSLVGRFRLVHAQGSWEVVVQDAGISSMHTAVTHFGNVVLLDRTNIGPSQLPLNGGRCRANPDDRVSTKDIFPLGCCDHRFFYKIFLDRSGFPLCLYSHRFVLTIISQLDCASSIDELQEELVRAPSNDICLFFSWEHVCVNPQFLT